MGSFEAAETPEAPDAIELNDPSFTTKDGVEWHPRILFSTMRAIKRKLGFDPLKPDQADGLVDSDKLPQAIYIVCEEEAKERDVTPAQFLQLIDAGPVEQMMTAWHKASEVFRFGYTVSDDDADGDDATAADPT